MTISGSGFIGATSVAFNGTNTTFTVASDTQISSSVPSGATTGVISVTTPSGSTTSVTSFTVTVAPTITSFTPTSGPVGTSVTISGYGFTGTTSVKFNGTSATFTVGSDSQINTSVPSGATNEPITITTSAGTGTSSLSFAVTFPPTITSFSPTSGQVGSSVTINGSGFTGATSVKFNGTSATFTAGSDSLISTSVPSGAKTGAIGVTTPNGTATSSTSFTVLGPPVVNMFSPSSGPVGTAVTISGSGFTAATAVAFNGTAAQLTVNSDTQITTSVPSGATTGPISVTTPYGTGNSAASFTVTALPVISGFSPTSGPRGTLVSITGSHFTGATLVTFSGKGASFTVVSDTQISTTVPSGAKTGSIGVTNSAGTTLSSTNFAVQ